MNPIRQVVLASSLDPKDIWTHFLRSISFAQHNLKVEEAISGKWRKLSEAFTEDLQRKFDIDTEFTYFTPSISNNGKHCELDFMISFRGQDPNSPPRTQRPADDLIEVVKDYLSEDYGVPRESINLFQDQRGEWILGCQIRAEVHRRSQKVTITYKSPEGGGSLPWRHEISL